ncbi:Protein argonaute-2 [Escovopsis weberi]|uniref:Protein argonaute-2 n=1 Tax=Escovopsis weberi TaxID=150374 RepID=A0A0M9VTI2_ESCWE|nr:Protein argonaute-2 [Escovopsis weberi]
MAKGLCHMLCRAIEVEDKAVAAAVVEVVAVEEVIIEAEAAAAVVVVVEEEEEEGAAVVEAVVETISGAEAVGEPGGVPVPDQRVTKLEDALLSGNDSNLSKLSLVEKFPVRPGYGTKGSGVTLWANYIAMTASPKLVLYRYDLSITPAVAGRKLTQVVRLLLDAPELASVKKDVVSDYKASLMSRQHFDDRTVEVIYRSEGEDEARDGAVRYKVKLQCTNKLAVSDFIDHLNSTNLSATYDEQLPMIQAFNIFLNHYAKSSGNLATIGASKTFSLNAQSETWDLQNCLTAVRGFFASVRAATGRILVNVNVSHGAFYTAGPLDKFVLNYGLHRGLYKVEKFIKLLRIKTTHLKDKVNKRGEPIPRIKTIFGLANKNDGYGLEHPPRVKAFGAGPKDVEFWLDSAPSGTSASSAGSGGKKKGGKGGKAQGGQPAAGAASGGKYVSVYDFFANTYGITVADPKLPVINTGTRDKPTYLPLQVCYVLPGQPAATKLDPSQTQQMIKFAVRRPAANAESIVTKGLMAAGLDAATNPLPGQFGITAASGLITVPGRVLVSPKLMYQRNSVNTGAATKLDLLFIILPASPIPLYNRIKHLGDVKFGIHTICSVGSKLANPKGQDQYFRNEALKFNLKLGGNNQHVEPSRLGFIAENKTMVVGLDVTHPSPGSAPNAPSIAGMVASVDSNLGQWPAILSIQPRNRQEMVADLKEMLKSRLKLWREKGKHASLPENILVYRDGVSEGQYQLVLDQELPLLRDACRESYPPADQKKGLPRITIVIAGKRHHTRFYPTAAADADRSGNTCAGTVVDRGVTEARNWDFFLQAHTALQGTARPAHYYVVLDEIFRQRNAKARTKNVADELQELTQSMCFVFGRATKAVSYCTPAYYADILCERARCYLSSLFESPGNSVAPSAIGSVAGVPGAGPSDDEVRIHERLKNTMFYI